MGGDLPHEDFPKGALLHGSIDQAEVVQSQQGIL